MNAKKTVSVLLLALGAWASVPAAHASGPYQIAGTTATHNGSLVRTELVVRAGSHPLDRFKMIRLVRDGGPSRGSILFLPPLGLTFTFYEQRDPNGAAGSSIAEFFALRGFDVYGYSPRFEGIPSGACEAGAVDCSVMAGWGLQSMVDDVAFVRSQIETFHPGTRIVVGGASLGGILAIAAVNDRPGDYDGVFPWEGMLFSRDPQVLALDQAYCAGIQGQLAAGALYDAVGGGVFKQTTQMADIDPSGLTLNPLFPPQLTNHQTLVLMLSVPTPGPVSMPVPNYIFMNGDLAQDRLFYASEPRVFENVRRFNSYVPLATVRDVSCSLAGVDTGFVSNLGSFHGPVLMIGGGRGFGPYMQDQLDLFGTTDKELRVEPGFGHIDHFMSERHRDFVEKPILDWATRVLGQ
jgi:pimeloyl-ACP methyl ester carboxylesterase